MTFNILLLGDGGVGKTTYVNRLETGDFGFNKTTETKTTTMSEVIPERKEIKITDCYMDGFDPEEKYDRVLIMFDCHDHKSYENAIGKWLEVAEKYCDTKDIFLLKNKVDIRGKHCITDEDLLKQLKNFGMIHDISSKSNYNFEKPLR